MTDEKFEMYCLVELMGRQRIAGMVSERVIAGQGMLQIDIPETKYNPKFTRFISPNGIYALNPIDEKTCLMYAENLRVKPIDSWDLESFMKKVEERKLELAQSNDDSYNSPNEDDD